MPASMKCRLSMRRWRPRPRGGSPAARLEAFFWRIWLGKGPISLALLPLSWIYGAMGRLVKSLYALKILPAAHLDVPVLAVGNLTVGGSGKTPFCIWLAQSLAHEGWKVGVVCRAMAPLAGRPKKVALDDNPLVVGDEALLLAQKTLLPVYAGRSKSKAAMALAACEDVDMILVDDGLQHHALKKDIEIAIIDGERRFGNGFLLPAGPLRESKRRLKRVDIRVCQGKAKEGEYAMTVLPGVFYNVLDSQKLRRPSDFQGERITAMAGIALPERFFALLSRLGLRFKTMAFEDHHVYTPEDLDVPGAVIMTEKDAVKVRHFAHTRVWALSVVTVMDPAVLDAVIERLMKEKRNQARIAKPDGLEQHHGQRQG